MQQAYLKQTIESDPNLKTKVRKITETKDGVYLKVDNTDDMVSIAWILHRVGFETDYMFSPSMGKKAVKRGSLKIIKGIV